MLSSGVRACFRDSASFPPFEASAAIPLKGLRDVKDPEPVLSGFGALCLQGQQLLAAGEPLTAEVRR